MKDEKKTKRQLLEEVSSLRGELSDLKRRDAEWARADELHCSSREEAERLAEEASVLADIGQVISSTLNIDEVYERFAAQTARLIPFDRIAVNLSDVRTSVLTVAYVVGSDIAGQRQGHVHPLTGTLTEAIIRGRAGTLLQPVDRQGMDEIVGRIPLLIPVFEAGLRSLMSVPLIARGEPVGALHFWSKRTKAYGDRDLRLAERIGRQIAGAIANAGLYRDLEQSGAFFRESEGRFRALFEQAAVGVAEIEMATGRFMKVNRRLCESLGRTEEELLATTFLAVTHPEDIHLHDEKTALLLAGQIGHYTLEKRYVRKDGRIVWGNITVSPLWKPGAPPGRNMIVMEDITERKRVEQENERRSRQLAALHETSVELMAEMDLNVLLRFITRRALDLVGGTNCHCYLYRPEEDIMERVASAGSELTPEKKIRTRNEGFVGHVWTTGAPFLVNDYRSWEGRKREYDGLPSRALVGAPIRWGDEMLGIIDTMAYLPYQYTRADLDILDMFAAQAAIAIRNARLYNTIERISITDELTGIYNRRGFFQLGEREFERALRFGRPLAVLMLDIDHFKRVNDTHGHPAGDRVLQALADLIRRNTRGIDVAGRYGGEEFALLLSETDLSLAVQIAERLRQSVEDFVIPARRPNHGGGTIDLRVTVSIGVALMSAGFPGLDSLIGRADEALYQAKDAGRNCVRLWQQP